MEMEWSLDSLENIQDVQTVAMAIGQITEHILVVAHQEGMVHTKSVTLDLAQGITGLGEANQTQLAMALTVTLHSDQASVGLDLMEKCFNLASLADDRFDQDHIVRGTFGIAQSTIAMVEMELFTIFETTEVVVNNLLCLVVENGIVLHSDNFLAQLRQATRQISMTTANVQHFGGVLLEVWIWLRKNTIIH